MSIAITSPDELEALPVGAVVLSDSGCAWQRNEAEHPYHWRSTEGTATNAEILLRHSKRGLVLIYTPHFPGEDGTAISDPDYLHTQRTIAGVICDLPHPLMLTEIHDLAYQITDALVRACIIPTPRPKTRNQEEL